jgi:putative FmdB family regulatory protein
VPLYEYQCARCGRFELILKFSDPPLLACPTCGGEVQKLFSAPAIQFKGTGWYITDYARKSGGKEPGKAGEGKSGESDSKSSAPKEGGSSPDTGSKADTAPKASSGGSGSKGSSGGSTS